MKTVYVTIGNSDDKLSQMEWGQFWADVNSWLHNVVYPDIAEHGTMHGVWSSSSTSQWQNACWSFEIQEDRIPNLRVALSNFAKLYRQDSIALAIADVEFVKP